MTVEELVVRHAGWIRRLARRYCMNDYDADDLAGETIYKTLSRARNFDCERDFKPWVMVIMLNTYKTLYNRRKCVQFVDLEFSSSHIGSDFADQRAAVRHICSAIRECSRKSRCMECVVLYAKGYSVGEIARLLDIPVGTVKSRLFAGRKMLGDTLGC